MASRVTDASVPMSAVEAVFWRESLRVVTICWLDGCVEEARLATAIRAVEARHPKLRTVPVEGPGGTPAYRLDRDGPPVAWSIRDGAAAAASWRDHAREMVAAGPTPPAPWAEVRALRDRATGTSLLIVAVYHAVADGRALIQLTQDLLAAYAEAEAGAPATVPPSPVLSDARVAATRWRDRLWLARRFLRVEREDRRTPWVRLPPAPDLPPLSQWAHRAFAADASLRLARRCRAEKASLTALLVAAAACAVSDAVDAGPVPVKWQSAFDVRESLTSPAGPVPADAIGSFMALMRGACRVAPARDLWAEARLVQEEIDAFSAHGGPAAAYRLVQLARPRPPVGIPPAADEGRPGSAERRRPTVFVTHYGLLALRAAYGSLRPTAFGLGLRGNPVTGSRLFVEGVVLGRQLNISVGACDALQPAFWADFHAAFDRHLDRAANA
jgi:hypothetical protein